MSADKIEFGGERMVITTTAEGNTVIEFNDTGTGRECGTCTLCCKLLPVKSLGKKAGERCAHVRHGKGCTIYEQRPFDCRTWACRWLADPLTAGLPRPDRAHYVIDMAEDIITVVPEDSAPVRIPVLQVWIDPAYPAVKDDQRLRAYLAAMGEQLGVAALLRFNSSDAIALLPPAMSDDGKFHEKAGTASY
jgi:hypothetical protein